LWSLLVSQSCYNSTVRYVRYRGIYRLFYMIKYNKIIGCHRNFWISRVSILYKIFLDKIILFTNSQSFKELQCGKKNSYYCCIKRGPSYYHLDCRNCVEIQIAGIIFRRRLHYLCNIFYFLLI
jgi:hypothetical protein